MSDMDDIDDDRTRYALTWRGGPADPPMYWSLRHGWTFDADQAWVLRQSEVDNIEADERLHNKLPQHKERKDGANWEPIYRRFSDYASGVSDDDDLFSTLI